jgi:DNA topoisomerase-2
MTTSTSSLSKQYQKKTDKEHILDAPDTYIGSIEMGEQNVNVMSSELSITNITSNNIIDGLYKIYDEAVVNSRDHATRTKGLKGNGNHAVSYIDIGITEEGVITIINDGNGIDVAEHPEHKLWIPEMIFGHLRTSTNYDKSEKKIVGGKNGFGVKLVFIWSEWGMVETVDHTRKLKYTQYFKENLDIIEKPKITKCTTKPYTKITFKPDYKRFGVKGLSTDMFTLFKRRVYDIAAVTDKTVKVKFNSQVVPIKNFAQYVDLYIGNDKEKVPRTGEEFDRWEYIVAVNHSDEFKQVSFVNGIYTSKGGKHVEYITNQIVKKLCSYINAKKKIDVKPSAIKEQLSVFLKCDIENPSFDSQTKDYMNTPSSKFGSSCTVSDKLVEKLAKSGVMQTACAISDAKDNKQAKKTDGSKSKTIRGIPKLVDANFAGTKKASSCSLIFCEGDSAKAGIMSGLSKEDRNYFGIYPLKGKLFNVRGEKRDKISDNKEISEIKQILGLVTGKSYKTRQDVDRCLRYGKVIFMTDQDLDGSHIKGLGINLFESEWPDLTNVPNFIAFMNTPILKATTGTGKNQITKLFYNDGEFNKWCETNDKSKYQIKYYKGLGTSTGKEFKEYFQEKKFVNFTHTGEVSSDSLDMAFNKKRPDDRKDWLKKFDRNNYLDTNKQDISFEEFIDREMIHFSKYDCDRSIPNIMDGLKISLRKILYSVFKKNLVKEIKVAQLSGYVSENSGYHHGEASLNGAIVAMAQNFVGSNNINLLTPNGQFGTRLQGGKDSASERYIFTQLNNITRCIYQKADDDILTYLDDDGQLVEPIFYAPIIPMILVNGTDGIGTGFSSKILSYNPIEIINWLEQRLTNAPSDNMQKNFQPYYHGFKGSISTIGENRYLVKGCYHKIKEDTIEVTELPIGFWTTDFKEHIETLLSDNKTSKKESIIKDYNDNSTDTVVNFVITLLPGALNKLESITLENNCNGLEKALKLFTTQTCTNMHLFDSDEKLKKYDNIIEILEEFYVARLELYRKRKIYQIQQMEKDLVVLSNKAKYIIELLDGTIDLRRKKNNEIVDLLTEKKYDKIEESFKYLIKQPMDCVSEENVAKILSDKANKVKELEYLRNLTVEEIWNSELNDLKIEYTKQYLQEKKNENVVLVKPNKKDKKDKKDKKKMPKLVI